LLLVRWQRAQLGDHGFFDGLRSHGFILSRATLPGYVPGPLPPLKKGAGSGRREEQLTPYIS
jgi:hypothetical protein